MPAPGSQAIIQLLPRLLPPTRVAVVTPSYREHMACWSAADHRVAEVGDPEDIPEDAGVLAIANPNNLECLHYADPQTGQTAMRQPFPASGDCPPPF